MVSNFALLDEERLLALGEELRKAESALLAREPRHDVLGETQAAAELP